MTKNKLRLTDNKRHLWALVCFSILFIALLTRLIKLQVIESDFLRQQGKSRSVRTVEVSANRGMIFDRNGEVLAVSTPVASIWLNPKAFDTANIGLLASKLQLKPQQIKEKLNNYKDKSFVYIARHVEKERAEALSGLNLAGVHLKSEYRRFYPAGETLAQVLGFTDIDDVGREGLELAYNSWLAGINGKKRIVQDRAGRQVAELDTLTDAKPGTDIHLSIDSKLQYLAYRELSNMVGRYQALSGSAVILDITTGEILAMVNSPSFNPNKRQRQSRNPNYRNSAATDFFEPGSTIKAFSIAGAIEVGKFTPDTVIDTNPGSIKLRGGLVRDDGYNYGLVTVSKIMQNSSNVGVSKLILKLPRESLLDVYQRFGFGEVTQSGFPGESAGILKQPNIGDDFSLATMSFGYGLAVTPLQLAQAYAVLGSYGIKRPVSLLKTSDIPAGERVISDKVCRQVVTMLAGINVNPKSKAKVKGYLVAGKTGTSRKIIQHSYTSSKHRAVFGGLAPAINPKFAIVVTIDQPQGAYYGNQVAAPVFASIAAGSLRMFNVSPDILAQGIKMAKVN